MDVELLPSQKKRFMCILDFQGIFLKFFSFVEEIFNGGIFVKAFIRLQHCEGYTNF